MADKEKFDFVPNSFQTPNDYIDKFMHLLTNSEFRCLIYATRKILGFQKRQDHISISQFVSGTKKRDGSYFDHGTGLGRGSVIEALDCLTQNIGLLIKVSDNDKRLNEGAEYALQLDGEKINYQFLLTRFEEWTRVRAGQLVNARKAKAEKKDTPSVEQTTPPVCLTDYPPSVEQTPPGMSNRLPPVCVTDTQNPSLNTILNPSKTQGSASALVASPTNGNGIVKNPGALKALEGWYGRKDQWDFSDFSESIRETIRVFCELWNVSPPARSKRRGGQFSLWEQEAAELQYACGEFKTDALRAYYEDWKKIKPDKKFVPGRPGSLTYYVTAKAAEMRTSKKGASRRVPTRAEFSQWVIDVDDPMIEDTDHDFKLWLQQQGVQTT